MADHSTITRRSFVAGAAGTAIAAGTGAAVAALPGSDLSERVNALMQRHEELCAQGEAIMQEYDAAYDLLPAWAQVGPEHMLSDGSRTGHRVGHPEVADPRPPQHEGYRTLIRPSFKNIKDRWDHPFHRPASTASEEVRRAYRKRRNDAIRKWIARKREQDAERAKVGLPELEGKADRFYDAAQTIQDELEAINDRHRQRQPDLRSPVSGTANRRRHRQA